MNRHDTAKTLVTDILERHPEARSSPLEVLRLVYYSTAHKAKVSRSRIDTTIDTIQEFNAASAAAAERAAIAEEYREHYSPKDDPDQTTLF